MLRICACVSSQFNSDQKSLNLNINYTPLIVKVVLRILKLKKNLYCSLRVDLPEFPFFFHSPDKVTPGRARVL